MTSEALDKYDVINKRSKYTARHKILVVIVCFVIVAAFVAFSFFMFAGDALGEEKKDGVQNDQNTQMEEDDEEDDWEDYDDEDFDLEDDYD
jgi:flagellar basal body-associated protein FliL